MGWKLKLIGINSSAPTEDSGFDYEFHGRRGYQSERTIVDDPEDDILENLNTYDIPEQIDMDVCEIDSYSVDDYDDGKASVSVNLICDVLDTYDEREMDKWDKLLADSGINYDWVEGW